MKFMLIGIPDLAASPTVINLSNRDAELIHDALSRLEGLVIPGEISGIISNAILATESMQLAKQVQIPEGVTLDPSLLPPVGGSQPAQDPPAGSETAGQGDGPSIAAATGEASGQGETGQPAPAPAG